MTRDDFTSRTRQVLAQRAGGRCSKPGCDRLCWLPGSEPKGAISVGVAAHIKSASREGGPRHDSSLTPEERKDIKNGIYLCQTHANLIDADEKKYSVTLLHKWKEKHEQQILGEVTGEWLFPDVQVKKGIGISFSATSPTKITRDTINDRVEHTLRVKNGTDFEFRRIGFSVVYPEFVEHPPVISGPPGFTHNLEGENMNWEASVTGGGSVTMGKITRYGSFTIEGSSLLPGQSISVLMRSTPDSIHHENQDNKIYYWVSGEVSINLGSMLKTQSFTLPLIYNSKQRLIQHGFIHSTDPNNDQYVTLSRSY